MRSLIAPRSERGYPELPLLSVARERGVFVRSPDDANHNVIPEDLSNYKVARRGDLVINKMKAWQGSLGTAPCDGIVSPAYYVYELALINQQFGEALLRSAPYIDMLSAASDGVRVGQWDLAVSRFRSMPVLVPSSEEQAAIVKFLRHAHLRIDRAIASKRKLISLLDEERMAVLFNAVTRGLDENASLKDSGLPWLGSIPRHWDLAPTRAVLRLTKSLVGMEHEEKPLLSLTKQGVIVRDLTNMAGKFSADQSTFQDVLPGQFVFCLFDVDETPRTVGLSAVEGMITGAYRVFDCVDATWAPFVELYFLAMDDHKLLSPLYTGLRKTIPVGSFLQSKMPFPPARERDEIVAYVSAHSITCNRQRDLALREIALLREFRTRLTADVVTGQVDVREVASTLPDVSDELVAAADAEAGGGESEELYGDGEASDDTDQLE